MLSRESLWTEYAAIELHRAMVRFRFELVPVDEVEPWGENRNLHWFGLTEGWFCLDVGGVDLLRNSEQTTARRSPTDGRTVPRGRNITWSASGKTCCKRCPTSSN